MKWQTNMKELCGERMEGEDPNQTGGKCGCVDSLPHTDVADREALLSGEKKNMISSRPLSPLLVRACSKLGQILDGI